MKSRPYVGLGVHSLFAEFAVGEDFAGLLTDDGVHVEILEEHAVFDAGLVHAVNLVVVLIGVAGEGDINRYVSREVQQRALLGLIPVRPGVICELDVIEHPVVGQHHDGIRGGQIFGLLLKSSVGLGEPLGYRCHVLPGVELVDGRNIV